MVLALGSNELGSRFGPVPGARAFHWAYPRNKKWDFSADFSAKNRFSGGMETILTKKIGRKKIGKKSGKIADFSAKNRKYPIFSRKNPIFPEILSKLYLGHSRERN